jgi:hypothetical protein
MPEATIHNQEPVITEVNPFEKIAESLNAQHNPIGEPVNQQFVSEPFFKEEEKPTEEVKEVVAEGAVVEEKKPELNEDGTVKETPAEVEKTEVEVPEEAILNFLNKGINDPDFSFGSYEELKSIVSEHRQYKEAENELSGLSKEERARVEIGREFGDSSLFDRVLAINTATITPKEALKQVYFFDNVGKNHQYLEKAFEKNYIKTYEEDPDEEFSKLQLENDGQEAKEKLALLQEDFKERGQVSGGTNPEDTKKAKEESDKQWFAAVDSVMSKNDRVTYSLEGGLDINIVMDANDKKTIQDAMDKPLDYVKSRITDENGNIDHEAIFEFIMRDFYFDNAIEEARKSGAASREDKILQSKKNTVIEQAKAGDAGIETPLMDQMAKNFSRVVNN